MNDRLFVLGSGPFAHEIAHYVAHRRRSLQVLDARAHKRNPFIVSAVEVIFVDDFNRGDDIISTEEYYCLINDYVETLPNGDPSPAVASIMGSGKPAIKTRMLNQIVGPIELMNLSDNIWTPWANIGLGSVLGPNCTIAPFVELEEHVLVNYNASVGHNTKIGQCSTVSPQAGIGGHCEIGAGVFVGAGATVREHIEVGDGAYIAMGAVVVKDVPPGIRVMGVPARER